MYYWPHAEILLEWVCDLVVFSCAYSIDKKEEENQINTGISKDFIILFIASGFLVYCVYSNLVFLYSALTSNLHYLKEYDDDKFLMILLGLSMHWISGLARILALVSFLMSFEKIDYFKVNPDKKSLYRIIYGVFATTVIIDGVVFVLMLLGD